MGTFVIIRNGPKMLQASTGASICDLISFTVDGIIWGELFLSLKSFLYWGYDCNRMVDFCALRKPSSCFRIASIFCMRTDLERAIEVDAVNRMLKFEFIRIL